MDWLKQVEMWLSEGFSLEAEKVNWDILEKKPADKPNYKGHIKAKCVYGEMMIQVYEKYMSLIVLTNIKNTYAWTIKEKVHAYKIMLKLSYEVPVCYAVLLGENDDVAIEGDIDLSNTGLQGFQNTCINVLAMKDLLIKRFKQAGLIMDEREIASKESQFIGYVRSLLKDTQPEHVARRLSENSGGSLSFEEAMELARLLNRNHKK